MTVDQLNSIKTGSQHINSILTRNNNTAIKNKSTNCNALNAIKTNVKVMLLKDSRESELS